ncbi:hypothetical protein PFUGPA_00728 [Plasmodium falciparum Palo Alto/Uganda]|uniref:Uncharacterized protein n=1 Tax=Plasmodium falciparum (isolate Palo Alto / Uganda) TaxID=57270 RepID=W4J6J3_PLAFP|nr:hypothetical protein PFUGPA_00728 [Plasmodium falciparum Palo Alto/Uganda]
MYNTKKILILCNTLRKFNVYNMVLLKELINIIEFKSMLKELKILYKVGIYKNIKTVWNNA